MKPGAHPCDARSELSSELVESVLHEAGVVQTPKAWDESSLRLFYDAIVQHGSGNFRRVRTAL